MQLPSKLQTGQNFKQATVRTVNNIIDYLHTQRIVGDNKTIRVNQLCSGLALSVPQSGGGGAIGGGTPANFPFKLYVSTDNNKPCVCMQEGRLLLQSTQSRPIAFRYEKTEQGDTGSTPIAPCLPINWQSLEDGTYLVIGVYRAYYANNQLYYQGKCLVVASTLNFQDIPCCEGYLSFYIGTIQKQSTSSSSSSESSSSGSDTQASYSLSIINNRIKSDLIVNDFMQYHPFGVYALIDHGNETQVKTVYTDWTITNLQCFDSVVYDDLSKQDISIQQEDLYVPSSGNNYLYLVFDKQTGDVYLQWTTVLKDAYVLDENDQDVIQKNYLLATVIISRNVINILQHVNNDLIFNQGDSYKIKIDDGSVQDEDLAPNFAVSKLYGDFGTLGGDAQSEYAGYIGVYEQQNAYSGNSDDYALKWKWCYDEISNYSTSDYIQLNANSDSLSWQPAYRVRVNQADTSPGFLSSKLEAGSHIQLTTAFNMIGIDATPPNIYGVSPIDVVQDPNTGWDFEISLDDSEFVKSIVNGTCITSSRNGTAVTIGVDKTCVFQNFSITASSPLSVSGSGQSWSLSFDDTVFLKNVVNGTCITSSRNGSSVTINVDKTCVFQNFSITASSPLSVSGSGQSWSLSFDDSAFVKSVGSSDNSISCSKSGTHVNLTTDAIRHLVIAPNLAGLIAKSTSGDTITLSLAQPPGLGMYVLTCQNGSAQWVEVGTCDDSSSSSSSSSEEPAQEQEQ